MYYGKAYPTSAEQKERVLRCLSDLSFIGSLGTDGTFSRGEFNYEKSMDWSPTRIEKVYLNILSELMINWATCFLQNTSLSKKLRILLRS